VRHYDFPGLKRGEEIRFVDWDFACGFFKEERVFFLLYYADLENIFTQNDYYEYSKVLLGTENEYLKVHQQKPITLALIRLWTEMKTFFILNKDEEIESNNWQLLKLIFFTQLPIDAEMLST